MINDCGQWMIVIVWNNGKTRASVREREKQTKIRKWKWLKTRDNKSLKLIKRVIKSQYGCQLWERERERKWKCDISIVTENIWWNNKCSFIFDI